MISNFYIFTARFIVQFCHFVFLQPTDGAVLCLPIAHPTLGRRRTQPRPPKEDPGVQRGTPQTREVERGTAGVNVIKLFSSSLTILRQRAR